MPSSRDTVARSIAAEHAEKLTQPDRELLVSHVAGSHYAADVVAETLAYKESTPTRDGERLRSLALARKPTQKAAKPRYRSGGVSAAPDASGVTSSMPRVLFDTRTGGIDMVSGNTITSIYTPPSSN